MFHWEKLGKIFTPQEITGRPWLKEYAQAPSTLIFDDIVRVYFSCRPPPDKNGQYTSYSAFVEADGTTTTGLAAYLQARGIRHVYLCGLATDYCVAWSALDARKAGFAATVIEDACRAIDLDGSLARARADMEAAGVQRILSADLTG